MQMRWEIKINRSVPRYEIDIITDKRERKSEQEHKTPQREIIDAGAARSRREKGRQVWNIRQA